MGTAQSREGNDLTDSEYDSSSEEESQQDEFQDAAATRQFAPSSSSSLKGVNEIDSKLSSLKLKYPSSQKVPTANRAKLYLHVGGSNPTAKWIISEKLVAYRFLKNSSGENEDDEQRDTMWVLEVGSKIRCRVSVAMQLKMFGDQKRVDFVDGGVWALKFYTDDEYRKFVTEFQNCLFENVHGLEATEENKIKVYGKEFIGWVRPEVADDSLWEDASDGTGEYPSPVIGEGLLQQFEEAANNGVQSLALGALDNSFLVNNMGVQVYKNSSKGIRGKGVCVRFDDSASSGGSFVTPKKAMLMRGETNMMLMNPLSNEKPHSAGVRQLDIETGKIVSEWKFEKDGTQITMRDITNDTKGAQLDLSESTFLGLDDNRLCQWDMRDKGGIVQNIDKSYTFGSPVLQWNQGHQFSRGTNFQCFASSGDGSIVVGSLDGKIRLYSKTSMRQAKTAFPGLGSPVTHVDVTFDGKWVLGTTDSYLILICTLFTDKDGKTKTGFGARMGNKIPSPRLLKLTPLDSHLAGDSKLHNGHFSWVTENGKQERHLVATVGKFSVVWDFQQVKNSGHECYRRQEGLKSCYCYKILLKDESIVESRFMHDNYAVSDSPEAPLVVATPLKVSSISLSAKRSRG